MEAISITIITPSILTKGEGTSDDQELACLCQVGHGVLQRNINNFTQHQCQTRPLRDHNGWRQE